MNSLDLYLQRVSRELRELPPQTREGELRELRSHLEQRAEDFEGSGLAVEEAQMRAVQEFGSARMVGSKLCDAWEGVPFSVERVVSALLGVTMIWIYANIAFAYAFMALRHWSQSALFPELSYGVDIASASLPLGCGWLLSRWLGRRGRQVTVLYFLGLLLLMAINRSLDFITADAFSIPPSLFTLAPIGAGLEHRLRRRQQRLAVVGGRTMAQASSFAISKRSVVLLLCLALLMGAGIWVRVYTALNPVTAVNVLRTSLLVNCGTYAHKFEPPTILEMRELPATTPVERVGREKRVQFQLEVRAIKSYRVERIAFLEKLLASPSGRKVWGEASLRSSLDRLRRNSERVQGVARLVQTPNGWQVDEKSFDRSQLWAWCDDLFFESKT